MFLYFSTNGTIALIERACFDYFLSFSASPPSEAWVTLATNDSYALGALVLAHSLRQVNTNKKIAIMITDGVTEAMK